MKEPTKEKKKSKVVEKSQGFKRNQDSSDKQKNKEISKKAYSR